MLTSVTMLLVFPGWLMERFYHQNVRWAFNVLYKCSLFHLPSADWLYYWGSALIYKWKATNTCRSEQYATVHDCTENVPGLTFLIFLGFVETIVFSERNCVVVWVLFAVSSQSFVLRHLVITPILTPRNYQHFEVQLNLH